MYDFEDQRQALEIMDNKPVYKNGWQSSGQAYIPPKKPKRFEEMGVEELKSALNYNEILMSQQYALHESMPDIGLAPQLQKLAYKISLIKTEIKKHEPDADFISSEGYKQLQDKIAQQKKHLAEMNESFRISNIKMNHMRDKLVELLGHDAFTVFMANVGK